MEPKRRASRRYLLAGLVLLSFCGVMYIKRGALAGSYDANYRARAAMLARDPALRDSPVFPELAVGGGEFAQVEDARREPVWQSAGLRATHRRIDRGDRDLLTDCTLPDGTRGWSVKVSVRLPDGSPGAATYGGTKKGFYADLRWVVGWLFGVFVLPVLVVILLYPEGRRPDA